jgi:hypothetical protein
MKNPQYPSLVGKILLVIACLMVAIPLSAQNAAKPNPELDRMNSMLADLAGSGYSSAKIAQYWNGLWRPAFDRPWVSKSGRTTSQLITGLVNNQEHPLHLILKKGEEDWAKDSSLKNSVVGLHVLCSAIFTSAAAVNPNAPAQFPSLLASRQDATNITLGDVITCRIVEDTLTLAQTHPVLPSEQTAAWVRLAQAKNPLYRLIAVRGFAYFTTTPEQAQMFYAALTNESEPGINKAMMPSLTSRTEQWATTMSSQVKAKLPAPTPVSN